MMRRSSRSAMTGVLCVLVGLSAGCSSTGSRLDAARLVRPSGGGSGLAPDSPANVLRLLEWCYNNRAIATHQELFTADYQFVFDPADSAGIGFRDTPWTRDDELISTTHLFVGGSADQEPASDITMGLDRNLYVYPDPDYAQRDPTGTWHKDIRTQLYLGIRTANGAWDVRGASSFLMVRGDSAAIPEELRLRGVGPDSSRWYIRRWLDSGAPPDGAPARVRGGGGAWTGRRVAVLAAQPVNEVSLGAIKVLYR